MKKKIVYIIGGLLHPDGMSQVLSQKINYLAEHTNYEMYMILTEKKEMKWYYQMSSKIKYINFDINFDELDTMPFLKKIYYYFKKQRLYKNLLTDYLIQIRPNITVTAMRREINFINDIKDGSRKVGEIHFNKNSYRQFNKRYIPKFICEYITKIWQGKLIKQIRKLDIFIVLSEEDKANWTEINNVMVIPNPLKYYPSTISTCNSKNVIAVGRYTFHKGFDLLIKSWSDVKKKHPNWTLNIYGPGDYKLYQNMARKNGVNDVIHCHNSVKDIYEKYIESSIFVFSSRFEGFGLVLTEAMSCGLPAVSFECPCGPKDIISESIDGFLVKPNDIKELSNKICFLIEHDEQRKTMGKNANKNMNRFSEEKIMQIWIKLFNAL
jgi:glycosyltransferase involved in cell wall biosynthesis